MDHMPIIDATTQCCTFISIVQVANFIKHVATPDFQLFNDLLKTTHCLITKCYTYASIVTHNMCILVHCVHFIGAYGD